MDFPYQIIRSGRRTLAIEIKNGAVLVRAPYSCSDNRITELLTEKEELIKKHLSRSLPLPDYGKKELEAMRESVREIITERVAHYSALMNLKPASVKITSAKTRFGSCSGKNSLCFSLYLALYPPEATDYVVVHELAHIKYKNHGKSFHKLVESYLPHPTRYYKELLKKRTEH